ncbi:hypothetical protein GN958_ATG07194 [Phytophthora infestans]|uniref:Uncharacterized protein n=1 Tax=Phytophthora infestans TaxID=4787 RepID=A0A8S9URR5_PHYIN|nr:hypothetical protein GN958_ATG07194 [Phytophthora infestans]
MSRRPAHRHACRLEDSSKDSEDTPARSEISGYDSSASVRDSTASASKPLGDDNSRDIPPQERLRAPELGVKRFASWGELASYLGNYSRRTYQLYSVRTATSVETRNERIKNNMQNDIRGIGILQQNVRVYTPRQSKAQPKCWKGSQAALEEDWLSRSGEINACARDTGDWKFSITKQITLHNHDLSAESYETYHQAQQVSDEEVHSIELVLIERGSSNT